MMVGFTAPTTADASGDVVDFILNENRGFLLCLAMVALATPCVPPLLNCMSRSLSDSRDQGWGAQTEPAAAAATAAWGA